MQELRDLARQLLTEGTVKVVIGYEEGPRGVRAAFVTRPEDADTLVFDARCAQNLASYLSPRRSHVAALGKAAVVVKGCGAAAVANMVREAQFKQEDVVLIGVRCGGVLDDPEVLVPITADTVSPLCAGCPVTEPAHTDVLVGPPAPPPPAESRIDARIKDLDAMSADERLEFWKAELARCVRCNACREACPNCFCVRCMQDKSLPQWIEGSPHTRGNLNWHMTRALHQAGRCVGCGECERACPMDIPLNLLNRKIAHVVQRRFGHTVTDDPQIPAPIGAYRTDDAQEFIR